MADETFTLSSLSRSLLLTDQPIDKNKPSHHCNTRSSTNNIHEPSSTSVDSHHHLLRLRHPLTNQVPHRISPQNSKSTTFHYQPLPNISARRPTQYEQPQPRRPAALQPHPSTAIRRPEDGDRSHDLRSDQGSAVRRRFPFALGRPSSQKSEQTEQLQASQSQLNLGRDTS